ncbi:MAG: LicD family protein [Selenomonadaceae bacterium]|nr:LicD family protein [Selenomonadaceae bacterium]
MQRQDNIGRQECISEIYKNQLDYVVRHTKVNRAGYYREQIQNVLNGVSANELLPATGNVRKHQLWKLDLAYQFVQRLNTELGISAPLTTGSLLGAARHGGFIPWDDDIDFALLSKDYKKFLDYALEATDIDLFFRNLENDLEVVTDTDGNRYEDKGSHKQYLALHGFGWCTLFYNLGASNIHENLPIADICPIYFYDKSWTVERYNDEVLNRVYQLQNKIEFSDDIDCTIDTPLEDLIQTGGRVGYGLNMAARISYWGLFHGRSRPFDSKIWDAADYFPIKDMRFEDKTFAVPNKYDKLLMQEYGENYMDIPLQVGILIHDKERLFNEYY